MTNRSRLTRRGGLLCSEVGCYSGDGKKQTEEGWSRTRYQPRTVNTNRGRITTRGWFLKPEDGCPETIIDPILQLISLGVRRSELLKSYIIYWAFHRVWGSHFYQQHFRCDKVSHKSIAWSHQFHSIMESVNILSIYMNFNAVGNGKSLSVSMICKFSSLTG